MLEKIITVIVAGSKNAPCLFNSFCDPVFKLVGGGNSKCQDENFIDCQWSLPW